MKRRILNRNIVPIIIIGMMFFVFGFATWINAMLIPYFKIACELSHFQSYLVTFAFYISYLVVSVPSSFLLKKIGFVNALRTCTLLGVILSLLVVTTRGNSIFLGHHADISIWFLVLLGFANSMIWAGIWPLALDRLGTHLKLGASILIMGLCGNAIVPLLYGYFADKYNMQTAYWVLLPCYIYLVFYAFYGYKIKSWKLQ